MSQGSFPTPSPGTTTWRSWLIYSRAATTFLLLSLVPKATVGIGFYQLDGGTGAAESSSHQPGLGESQPGSIQERV